MRNVCQTVRRVTNEILGVKGLKDRFLCPYVLMSLCPYVSPKGGGAGGLEDFGCVPIIFN